MKKKFTKKALAIFSIITLFCLMSFTVEAAGGYIAVSSGSGQSGDTVKLSVNINENPGINLVQVSLTYDSNNLNLENVSAGSAMAVQMPPSFGSGCAFLFDAGGTENVTTTGNVLNLTFKVKDEAKEGSYPVSVSVSQAIDKDGKAVSFSGSSGSVTVQGCQHENSTWTTTKEATCTEDGEKTLTCPDCGFKKTEVIKASHSWEEEYTTILEPTCTTDGKAVIKCKNCDEIKEEKVLPASHNWEDSYSVIIPSTCTTDGVTAIKCKNCDEIKDEQVIKASHTWSKDYVIIKPATCTEDGEKAYQCTVCGEITDKQVVPAGHSFTQQVISIKTLKTEATTDSPAQYFYTCSGCGQISTDLYFESGETVPTDIEYVVTQGSGVAYKYGEGLTTPSDSFVVSVDASADLLKSISVNGTLVDKENYEVSNAIDITFKDEFMQTLEDGTHDMEIIFADGKAELSFIIKVILPTPSPSPTPTPTPTPTPEPTSSPIPVVAPSNSGNSSLIVNTLVYSGIVLCLAGIGFGIFIVIRKLKEKDSNNRYRK